MTMKYYQWFKDCIEAVYVTHIPVIALAEKAIPIQLGSLFFGHAVYMVMVWMGGLCPRLLYIYGGYHKTKDKLPTPTLKWVNLSVGILMGKYYIVVAGYPNTWGYFAPDKDFRYHLQDCRSKGRARGQEEIFNHIPSSLWNIIEMFPGIESSFSHFQKDSPYSLQTQVLIVVTGMTLHNYIRQMA